ncbi:glycosyltransferase family 2 protein [Methylobacterium brachiatum]|uniref:glycosyltransferase family 2 protein n=1 Tax=Methylobacterium brachiatum TaxID=269660 RepID=UPI003315504B
MPTKSHKLQKFDITAIVNAHEEGEVIFSTLYSLKRAYQSAAEVGVSVEVFVILDRPDVATCKAVSSCATLFHEINVHQVDYGDLGLARNFGISKATGSHIAFLDGDDMWSSNWLIQAFIESESLSSKHIWHPDINIYFGDRNFVYRHMDMDSKGFKISKLALKNAWTALCFASKDIFIEVPYRRRDVVHGIGFEDWSWNLKVIEKGCVHKVVPGTFHAIRTRSSSLVTKSTNEKLLYYPTDVFRNAIAERQI